MLQIKSFVFSPFQENTYVVFDSTNDAVIIDAGCYTNEEFGQLKSFISTNNLNVKHILNTHCHIDHVFGNHYVCNEYQLFPKYSIEEVPVFNSGKSVASMYGLNYSEGPICTDFIREGDNISFGNTTFSLMHLPGHSPGSIGFYSEKDKTILSGDVLFKHSIGRTDLPLGNHQKLIESIQTKMFNLPEDVIVYSGHGDTTSIGEEKKSNPFFN